MIKRALILMGFFAFSCISRNSADHKNKESCINHFYLGYGLNNPQALVFRINASDSLESVLLSQRWDSILFNGDILNSIKIRQETIEVSKEDSSDMLFIVGTTAKLYYYSQYQLDSIAAMVYKKLEILIFSKKTTWTLKPCISASKDD